MSNDYKEFTGDFKQWGYMFYRIDNWNFTGVGELFL